MKIIKDSKLLLKIFSALIAVVLWFAITYTEDPAISQHLSDINTIFSGEARLREHGLIVVNKDELPAISATIRGNRSKVIASLGLVSASVDVSQLTEPGTHEAPIEYRFPSEAVMLTKTKITRVPVTVEKILSRDIPIKIHTNYAKDTDYVVESKGDVEAVTVRGAQSIVEQIDYALVEVESKEISSNGTMDYGYKLYDKDDNLLNEKNILSKSQNTILVTNTIYNKTELPVEVALADALKENYTLQLNKQSVSTLTVGYLNEAPKNKLLAVLNEDATKERSPMTVDIQLPEGIFSPEEPVVTVEYELLPKTVHELEIPVHPEKVPDGKKVTTEPEKIKVSVKCAKNDAVADNLSATFDASELKEGEKKTVTLNITAKDNIEVLGVYTISAMLQ